MTKRVRTPRAHALALAILALAPFASGNFHEPIADVPDRIVPLVMQGTAFNGFSYPDTPLLEAAVGERVHFLVHVPAFAETHTFHVHGHPWRLSDGRLVDTFLLRPGDTHRFDVIAGGADGQAGDWMYHCHVDVHVEGGMWGVFRVYPYKIALVGAPGPAFAVDAHRLGEPLDDADIALTLDGAPIEARITPQGHGRSLVHAPALDGATGSLVVTATHALGTSVARAVLGDAPERAPTAGAAPLPGHAH